MICVTESTVSHQWQGEEVWADDAIERLNFVYDTGIQQDDSSQQVGQRELHQEVNL